MPSLGSFYLYQLKRRKGTWLFMFYANPIYRCTLSVAVCVTSHVSVFCVCAPWDMCSALLLVEPANRKVAVMSLSLSRNPGSPGWDPVAGQEGILRQSCWRRWPLLIPLNMKQHRKQPCHHERKESNTEWNNSQGLYSGNFPWRVFTPQPENCLGNSSPLAFPPHMPPSTMPAQPIHSRAV